MRLRMVCAVSLLSAFAASASAQQRPLITEDPEPVGAGRILVEGGLDYSHNYQNTVSGLKGDLLTVPTVGFSFGISSIAELQIDGSLYNSLSITSRNPNAPLASLLTVSGNSTSGIGNATVGMKIRLLSEAASRPAIAIRFATKLPNASSAQGIDLDTTDFAGTLLIAKTVQSIRVVGNIGGAILADPVVGHRQNDVFVYGLSFARAVTQAAELVGEINGRESTRSGDPIPGTESRGIMKLGGRYTHGSLRLDAAVFFGLTSIDPTVGFTTGFTYVFNAFKLP